MRAAAAGAIAEAGGRLAKLAGGFIGAAAAVLPPGASCPRMRSRRSRRRVECALGFAVLLLSVGLAGHASEAGVGAGKALPRVEEAAKGVEGKHLMTVDELYGYGGLGDDAGQRCNI